MRFEVCRLRRRNNFEGMSIASVGPEDMTYDDTQDKYGECQKVQIFGLGNLGVGDIFL